MQSISDSKFSLFLKGLSAPFYALDLIFRHKKLLLLSFIPFAISLIVIGGLVSLSSVLIPTQWSTLHFGFLNLGVLSQWLVGGLILILGFQFISVFLNLAALPFNDALALHTEKVLGHTPPEVSLKESMTYLFNDLKRTLIVALLMLIFIVGSWIPALGLFFMMGIAFLNTINYVSYALNRRGGTTLSSLVWVKANWPQSLGFGIAASLLFSIPVVNLFALSLCVVGGTKLYLD